MTSAVDATGRRARTHHEEAEEDRRVVVRHLEIPSAAPAEDQQRRPRKHDRFTEEEEVRELHRRALEAHHPVRDRRLCGNQSSTCASI